jgi:hypothetical protein
MDSRLRGNDSKEEGNTSMIAQIEEMYNIRVSFL